jgi:hypothetical protein
VHYFFKEDLKIKIQDFKGILAEKSRDITEIFVLLSADLSRHRQARTIKILCFTLTFLFLLTRNLFHVLQAYID